MITTPSFCVLCDMVTTDNLMVTTDNLMVDILYNDLFMRRISEDGGARGGCVGGGLRAGRGSSRWGGVGEVQSTLEARVFTGFPEEWVSNKVRLFTQPRNISVMPPPIIRLYLCMGGCSLFSLVLKGHSSSCCTISVLLYSAGKWVRGHIRSTYAARTQHIHSTYAACTQHARSTYAACTQYVRSTYTSHTQLLRMHYIRSTYAARMEHIHSMYAAHTQQVRSTYVAHT